MQSFFSRNLKRQYPQIKSGQGVWVTDSRGKTFLDGCSGAVVANIGHGVAEINEAINEQLSKIAFVHSSQFVSEAALALADRLVSRAPQGIRNGGRAFFVCGGSEAVETSLKMARAFFYEKGMKDRRIVISRLASYHGASLGALSATGHPARRKPYLPVLADNPHISASHPYRCPCGAPDVCQSESCGKALADELEKEILAAGADNVMAFIAEPVVGAALGAAGPHPGYFKRIREICDRHQVLFIADEVMAGMGRLGTESALSVFGVEADIVALGKGLAAGYMPLGAVLASGKVVAAFENGSGIFEHGFTYSAHPVACAAGLAVLNYVDEHRLFERVIALEDRLKNGLNRLYDSGIVGNVRGKGFFWGVEFVQDRAGKTPFAPELRVCQKLGSEAAQLGLLVYPGGGAVDGNIGDHIIVAPPYTISESEIDELLQRLTAAVASTEKSLRSAAKV
jgi:adenosylmethionine-8-amino-7-oxononanoate aminotransferase